MTQENLRDEYCPARVYQSTAPNKGHIRQLSFTDEYLSKPNIPLKPELSKVKDWKPILLSVVLGFVLLIPRINVLALFGLIGIWTWALIDKFPKYKKEKKKADIDYQRKLKIYQKYINNYQTVLLPEWEKGKRSQILNQKMQEELVKIAIDEVWRQKSWKVHSQEEIQSTRTQGYIGKGEDHLVNALLKSPGIYTYHQVEIEPYYTADIVCLNLVTGKLCVVEVDGCQHWKEIENIERDKRRMESLAAKGVPTIRFVNTFAASSPYECVKHIQKLLS